MNTGRVAGSLVASAAGWIANLAVTWAALALVALSLPAPAEPDLRGEHAIAAVVLAFVSVVLSALIRELLPFNLEERKLRLRRSLATAKALQTDLRQWMAVRAVRARTDLKAQQPTGVRRWKDIVAVAAWITAVLASSIVVGCLTTSFWAGVMTTVVCAAMVGTVLVAEATTLRGLPPRGMHWLALSFVLIFLLGATAGWIAVWSATSEQAVLAIGAAIFSFWTVLIGYAWLSGFSWWRVWRDWTLPAVATRLRLDRLRRRTHQLARLKRAVSEADTDTP